MAKLVWDDVGERTFETGIDRGVLYHANRRGVAWNGLTRVSESPSGGEMTPYYIDGIKYLNVSEPTEFEGRIEAFTYPEEFELYDGWTEISPGLSVDNQERHGFHMSYRTKLGDDVVGHRLGYKLHMIYNVLTSPSQKDYQTLGDNVDPTSFSWNFTTTPTAASATIRASHFVVNSTKVKSDVLSEFERRLYGSSSSAPIIPKADELIALFEAFEGFEIIPAVTTGLAKLTPYGPEDDLSGNLDEGLFSANASTRLTQTNTPGLYTLE